MNDVDNKVKMIIEGLLLAAGRPLPLESIAAVFNEEERPENEELLGVLARIDEECGDYLLKLMATSIKISSL